MIFHSTNNTSSKANLPDAISGGIAPDGGLYMPDTLPKLPKAFFRNIGEMSLNEISYVIMTSLIGDTFPAADIKQMVDRAINFDIPLREISPKKYLLELFHGPTGSFKDIASRLMANMLSQPTMRKCHAGTRPGILLATSGDSGGAVAAAFSHAEDIKIYVTFPANELTRMQIAQFASQPGVCAIEVEGSFDDCQHLVKAALTDPQIGGMLTSGNSINPARELPSIIYFFHAYARAVELHGEDVRVVLSIPCGNLGSFCAALMAKQMGLPIKKVIAANNANDAFVEFLKTGGFKPQRRLITLARAMDVGNPSNIARIIDLYHGDISSLRNDVTGYSYSDEEIAHTMQDVYHSCGYIIDPQSATAFRAIDRHLQPGEVGIAMASAHPAKSALAVKQVLGIDPPVPKEMQHLADAPLRIVKIPPTLSALKRVIDNR